MSNANKVQAKDKRNDLFRPEAVEHMRRRLEGEVVLSSSPQTRMFSWLFVVIVAAVVIVAFSATYSRRETVPGWIVPEGGLIRVVPRQAGTVTQLLIGEGAVLSAGDIVARLEIGNGLETGTQADAALQAVGQEAAALATRSSVARAQIGTEGRRLSMQRAGLERELAQARVQVDLLQRQHGIARDELARGRELAERGFLSRAALDRLRTSELAAAGQVSQAQAAILASRRQLDDLQQMIAQSSLDLADVEAQSALSMAAIEQKRVNAEGLGSSVLTAPIAGSVAAVPVEIGQTVMPGQAVAVLAPEGAALIAELYVPSRAIGFLEVGQEVRLMYQAYPHQKFGVGIGRIVEVSDSILAASEVAMLGVQFPEPVFRVRASLSEEQVSAYGEKIALRPGMLLSADLVIDRRTLIEWLLDPLYASGRR